MANNNPSAPIVVTVEHPDSLSRLHLLVKSFFGFMYVGIAHSLRSGNRGLAVISSRIRSHPLHRPIPETPLRPRRRLLSMDLEGHGLRRPLSGQLHGRQIPAFLLR